MASNNSVNSNDALHTNVRVKIEPGTFESPTPSTSSSSSSPSPSPSVPLSERVTSIKIEPGLPVSTQRLISYRLPRDLTLGGNLVKMEKPKKVYVPNLNVQRNKKKDDPGSSIKPEPIRSRHSDRGRERKKEDRGRGKRDGENIIQTTGVFSEGIYTSPFGRRKYEGFRERASSSTGDSAKYLNKSQLNKIANKTEEEKKLNVSSDDLSDDYPENEKLHPLTLPRIKKEMYNTIDDDKTDKKPIISKNAIIKGEENKQDIQKKLGFSQIIEKQLETNDYTLIQFPESLPGWKSSERGAGSNQSNNSNTLSESDNKAKPERCNLSDLKSGFLGNLQILKSGKARLHLGKMDFVVEIGTEQSFQQDLLAVKIGAASHTGDLVNLGPVKKKLICSLNFESMLEDS